MNKYEKIKKENKKLKKMRTENLKLQKEKNRPYLK